MTPYILVGSYKLFKEICYSRHQDNILTKEATFSFKTLCTTYRLHSVMAQSSKNTKDCLTHSLFQFV
jgi:hypothetical protein